MGSSEPTYKTRLLHELGKIKRIKNTAGRPYALKSINMPGENAIKVNILRNYNGNGTSKPIAAYMYLNIVPSNSDEYKQYVEYSVGETIPKFRRRGLGFALRGLIAKAAANVGFERIDQTAIQYNNRQYKHRTNRPISGIIMTTLGSTRIPTSIGAEHHRLNLKNQHVRNKLKKVHNNFVLNRNN